MRKDYTGIVVSANQFEEKGIIVNCITNQNTLKAGLMKGISKKQQIVSIGNVINFTWSGSGGTLGAINAEVGKSFGSILATEKNSCGIAYCSTFLINTLFTYDISHTVDIYLMIYNYFEFLTNNILKIKNTQQDQHIIDIDYFQIEKIIIKNAGWLQGDGKILQDKDLRLLFENLNIKNTAKFFFYRKMIT